MRNTKNPASDNNEQQTDTETEAGIGYMVDNPTTRALPTNEQHAVKFLVRKMLWDQQEKVNPAILGIGKEGNMEVKD